jgi:hypothetical protein
VSESSKPDKKNVNERLSPAEEKERRKEKDQRDEKAG